MISQGKRIKELKKLAKFQNDDDGFDVDSKERAIIDVGAENYDDIYSPYCYKGGDTVSRGIEDYLEKKADTIPLDYDLKIKFHVKDADPEKRKDIANALRTNYENDIRAINKRMSRNNVFSLYLLLLGLVFFLVYVFTIDIVPFWIGLLLELMFWVLIWEALYIFFLDRHELQLEKLKKYRLLTAKIVIVEFEPY